ncbi:MULTISPECIES: hypothetical protein [Sulfitobacter]|uniref:Membrane domain of glycerophosphoryl diester phosphodiesterase n=1 Tax=Sulfitobacter dubius TaxID=218673 RepID=A0ABY3ZII9_9RHOB|nr:hypothetical protein [Sulfitobacter dubius]UOA14292.1 hypothetical protein DSM109990_01093 [Sulfitobacter dubius]WOI30219.1 hypothetical protein R1T39_05800 [Sulfitobacter dubius]
MIQATALFTHALNMLFHAPATTLRVILPAVFWVMGAAAVAGVLAGDALGAMDQVIDRAAPPPTDQLLILIACGLAGILGYALMAVLWHRHVLLDRDATGTEVRPGARLFWSYVWRAIVLGFVQFLAAIPIGIAMLLVGGLTGSSPAALLLIGLVAGVAFLWLALRLSLVLPAAAMGHVMAVSESWRATEPLSRTLWALAVLLAVVNTLLGVIAGMLLPADPGLRLMLDSVLYLIEGLVFVSMLTTLYGHLIEGRELG